MNQQEMKKIIHETVHETLSGLGFDTDEPRQMQQDLFYLRKLRQGSEFMTTRVKAALIATLIPTMLYLAWEVIRRMVK